LKGSSAAATVPTVFPIRVPSCALPGCAFAWNCSGGGSGRIDAQAGVASKDSGGQGGGVGDGADQGNGSPDAAIEDGAVDTSGAWYGHVERVFGFPQRFLGGPRGSGLLRVSGERHVTLVCR
jgi:hypothetical protein